MNWKWHSDRDKGKFWQLITGNATCFVPVNVGLPPATWADGASVWTSTQPLVLSVLHWPILARSHKVEMTACYMSVYMSTQLGGTLSKLWSLVNEEISNTHIHTVWTPESCQWTGCGFRTLPLWLSLILKLFEAYQTPKPPEIYISFYIVCVNLF